MADVPASIAYVGAAVGLIGGGLALFNARKAVLWKRAELANSYLRDLSSNDELVFACRAIDWMGGLLVVPAGFRPLLPDRAETIVHDPDVLARAMRPDLPLRDLDREPRLQIYRTAMDGLLSWLGLIASALERKLFAAADVMGVGYWVHHIEDRGFMEDFIATLSYQGDAAVLRKAFRPFAHHYTHRHSAGAAGSVVWSKGQGPGAAPGETTT